MHVSKLLVLAVFGGLLAYLVFEAASGHPVSAFHLASLALGLAGIFAEAWYRRRHGAQAAENDSVPLNFGRILSAYWRREGWLVALMVIGYLVIAL